MTNTATRFKAIRSPSDRLHSSGTTNWQAGDLTSPAVHEDHIQRDFTSDEPNRKWVTDITEHPTGEGKVYCCAIRDLFSNRIDAVAHALNTRPRKVLGWKTPAEAFDEQLRLLQQPGVASTV